MIKEDFFLTLLPWEIFWFFLVPFLVFPVFNNGDCLYYLHSSEEDVPVKISKAAKTYQQNNKECGNRSLPERVAAFYYRKRSAAFFAMSQ